MSKAAAQGAQRPTRRAAQQHRYADMQVEGNGEYSSYDEPVSRRPAARATPARFGKHPLIPPPAALPAGGACRQPGGPAGLPRRPREAEGAPAAPAPAPAPAPLAPPLTRRPPPAARPAAAQLPALRKYSRLYELPNVDQQTTHADLTFAVSRHWNTAVGAAARFSPLLSLGAPVGAASAAVSPAGVEASCNSMCAHPPPTSPPTLRAARDRGHRAPEPDAAAAAVLGAARASGRRSEPLRARPRMYPRPSCRE
jgi:hypothetical protein